MDCLFPIWINVNFNVKTLSFQSRACLVTKLHYYLSGKTLDTVSNRSILRWFRAGDGYLNVYNIAVYNKRPENKTRMKSESDFYLGDSYWYKPFWNFRTDHKKTNINFKIWYSKTSREDPWGRLPNRRKTITNQCCQVFFEQVLDPTFWGTRFTK